MAQPVMENGRVRLIVALRIPIDVINGVMQERSGMGETGETYLVGSDKLMRSDSSLDPHNHSVIASFSSPDKGRVDTEASREALSGKTGEKVITDFDDNPALSAYTPLQVWDTTWGLIATIDKAEAFAAVNSLKKVIGVITMIGIIAIIVSALWITHFITGPISCVVKGLNEAAYWVAAVANEVAASSRSLSENATKQAASVEETSGALEEMTAMSRETSELTRGAEELMNENIKKSGQSLRVFIELTLTMTKIESYSDEMGQIIKTIDAIAYQTNLLALNAAVEAALAGESGAGFGVVAQEVRNLALKAADAAKNTQELLDSTVDSVIQATHLIKDINNDFGGIIESATIMGEKTFAITEASKELAKGVEQVSIAVIEIDKVTQHIAGGSQESAAVSEKLTVQAKQMRGFIKELVAMIGSTTNDEYN